MMQRVPQLGLSQLDGLELQRLGRHAFHREGDRIQPDDLSDDECQRHVSHRVSVRDLIELARDCGWGCQTGMRRVGGF